MQDETLTQREAHDAEQQRLAQMGKPPNAAEWACFFRREEARQEQEKK